MGLCGRFARLAAPPKSAAGPSGIRRYASTSGRGSDPACDRKPRQGNSLQNSRLFGSAPAAVRRLAPEVDHELRPAATGSYGTRRMPSPRTSISPASAGGRAHQQPAVRGLDMDAVVGDQPRERQDALRAPRAAAPAPAATCRSRTAPGSARRARRPARRRRGSSEIVSHIAGRRTMKRAPSTLRLAVRRDAATPVRFSAQMPAAMRLDDLLGDRQAEAGVLAEALMRPVGVEALEDLARTHPAGCPARRRRRRSRPRCAAAGR